jgi:hypothetical protein
MKKTYSMSRKRKQNKQKKKKKKKLFIIYSFCSCTDRILEYVNSGLRIIIIQTKTKKATHIHLDFLNKDESCTHRKMKTQKKTDDCQHIYLMADHSKTKFMLKMM